MEDFPPSPRASKRRRTATYATRRTTLTSSSVTSDGTTDQTKKTDSPRNSRKRTAEDEIADIIAGAQAETRPKHVGRRRDADDEDVADEDTQPDVEETDPVQTRSAGRPRGSRRKSSPTISQPAQKFSPLKRKVPAKPAADRNSPAKIFSPQPKGILTPSRHGRGTRSGPRKSVVFQDNVAVEDKDKKQIEEHFGFKDINSSSKKKKDCSYDSRRDSESPDSVGSELFEDAEEFPDAGTSNGVDEEDIDDDFVSENILAADGIQSDCRASSAPLSEEFHTLSTEDEDPQLTSIKLQILRRITNHARKFTYPQSPIPSFLDTQYATLCCLLTATVTAGESNSLLLFGSRGSGKSMLLDHAVADLQRSHLEDFHVVRLNGFFQTDDKLALREIWRQLGREMAVPEDETGEVSSYADTMASLLSLLSHPEEFDDPAAMDVNNATAADGIQADINRTAKSVIFIMDEFDLFTTHPRQTLLYNLFDIAQAKKAPVAVIGCSTRMDVIDCLEKRVKSRFSHRWLHVPAAKSLVAFEETLRDVLCLPVEGKEALGVAGAEMEWRTKWNEHIKTRFLPDTKIHALVKKTFVATKSLPDLLMALYVPIATLSLPVDESQDNGGVSDPPPSIVAPTPSLPSLLSLMPHLPLLHLSLLISATRLETIYDVTSMNFALVHKQYTELLTRSKLQRSSLSAFSNGGSLTGAGLRSWSKDTARGAWEELAQWEFVVPASGSGGVNRPGDEGLGGDGLVTKMVRVDVTLDEVAWAVKEKLGGAGAGETLIKWCKEI